MAQLVVRNIDDIVKEQLKRRARLHGHSMEEEVRDILRNALKDDVPARLPLGQRLRELFAGIGLEEDIPEIRGQPARPADFGS